MAATVQQTSFTYKTDPSAGAIPAHVHYAPASPAARPIALVFHAGGFAMGAAAMVPATEIAALVGLGFVVVTPEYRLAPQVGVYDGPVTDAKAVLAWAQATLPGLLAAEGITADGTRVVAMGHSAGGALALHLGGKEVAQKPLAVVDFYGPKDFGAPWASKPSTVFAGIPDLPEAFLNQVHDGPTVFTTPPMIKDGKPDLASPRSAWFITTLKKGTNIAAVVKDGNVARADPIEQFDASFPPTMFVHGTADVFVPGDVSRTAHAKLTALGVRSELVEVEGAAHVFDFTIGKDDELFTGKVMPALRFLAQEAGLQV